MNEQKKENKKEKKKDGEPKSGFRHFHHHGHSLDMTAFELAAIAFIAGISTYFGVRAGEAFFSTENKIFGKQPFMATMLSIGISNPEPEPEPELESGKSPFKKAE